MDTHAPPLLVLGTAGHIDHGKTALIRALTGIDTDRLPEEKARGITIELGFAPLDLGDGQRVGVVDVPGHEALVRTMVAGATGIDLVLLVVAADEGVMPQTREHLAICGLLGLRHGVVALTKRDLVDAEVAALAEEEVREALATTELAEAPIVRVSAQTGEGVEALRRALAAVAREAAARTPREGPPRLAIDRLFAARGFGAVVTGTLIGAPLRVGDAVEVLPSGRGARVRGLQRFGEPVSEVPPGARCAVNLQGIDLGSLARGDVLTRPGALPLTHTFDAELQWLPEAPPLEAHPTSVELLAGTSERRARVAPIGTARVEPGGRAFGRVHVEGAPLALLPDDRFVLRGFARTAGGGSTLGGGRVLDVEPPRRRRGDPALRQELVVLAKGDVRAGLVARVTRAGFAGAGETDLARATGLDRKHVHALLAAEGGRRGVSSTGGETWIATKALEALERRLLDALHGFHREKPLEPGMPRGALRGALPPNAAPGVFERLLERLAATERVEVEEATVRATDFVPRLTQREEAIAARLRADAMIAGLEPPTLREWSQELGVDAAELRSVLAHLERDGSLTRAPGELWFDRVAVDELRERVVAHLEEHGELDTAAYKSLIGTTRKYAVPLMELFDDEHLTVRRGETRVLRRRPRGTP